MDVEDDDERQQPAVVVLDDRPLVRLGLQAALAGVRVTTEVVLVGRVPDVVAAVRALVQQGRTAVVVLDDVDRSGLAAAALDAGSLGAVLTGCSVAELIDVVRRASRGEVVVVPVLAERLEAVEALRLRFTPRERDVLRLYATGLPAKSVARRMGVGLETVKTYLKRLREKAAAVGVPTATRLELAALARQLDLL